MTRVFHAAFRLCVGVLLVLVTTALGAPALVHAAAPEEEGPFAFDDDDAGSCEDALDPDDRMVACGAEFLAHLTDQGKLRSRMSARTCSVLIDELFDGRVCQIGELDCGEVLPALPAPPSPDFSPLGSSSAGGLVGSGHSLADRDCVRFGPATSDRVPRSESAQPPTPPPEPVR